MAQVSGMSLVVSAAHFLAPGAEDFNIRLPAVPILPVVILISPAKSRPSLFTFFFLLSVMEHVSAFFKTS